jgi:hypothetical protein
MKVGSRKLIRGNAGGEQPTRVDASRNAKKRIDGPIADRSRMSTQRKSAGGVQSAQAGGKPKAEPERSAGDGNRDSNRRSRLRGGAGASRRRFNSSTGDSIADRSWKCAEGTIRRSADGESRKRKPKEKARKRKPIDDEIVMMKTPETARSLAFSFCALSQRADLPCYRRRTCAILSHHSERWK